MIEQIRLQVDDIIFQHDDLLKRMGEEPGFVDRSILEGIVGNIYQSFDRVEMYPTIKEKAARLLFAIATTQAFKDGNKRAAILSAASMLGSDGIFIQTTDEDIIQTTLAIANNEMSYEDILSWINRVTK